KEKLLRRLRALLLNLLLTVPLIGLLLGACILCVEPWESHAVDGVGVVATKTEEADGMSGGVHDRVQLRDGQVFSAFLDYAQWDQLQPGMKIRYHAEQSSSVLRWFLQSSPDLYSYEVVP